MSRLLGRSEPRPLVETGVAERAAFIQRTYVHLFGAIAAFTGLEVYLFRSGLAWEIARSLVGVSWLLVMGAFVVVGWAATHFARGSASRPAQYLGLSLYVVAEAVIFTPILAFANLKAPGVIQSAAIVTLGGFAALSSIVIVTRKDFSFLRGVVAWGFVLALIAIVAGLIFGFQLGTWFSLAMVAIAGCSVLYDTSNVLHHYREDGHVGAALDLFASIAVLFFYVLRLFLSDRR